MGTRDRGQRRYGWKGFIARFLMVVSLGNRSLPLDKRTTLTP
jgi:hypothetical protein